jgi:4-oxalocrotonate tautomerase
MPIVQISLFEGRTVEQKRELAARLTETFVEVLGAPRETVRILFHDYATHDWAIAGRLRCDRDA